MANKANLVIVGVCVGLTLGILVAVLVFFGIRWYKRRSHPPRSASERSSSAVAIRTNGFDVSIDSSASLSISLPVNGTENHVKNSSSWWGHHSNERLTSASGLPRYSYKDIQKATHNFTTILGQGSFGPVYKAIMPTGEVVAIKTLASDSKQGEKEFQTEVSLLARLHHRNLVNLVGYCVDKGQHMLIYEFMSNGSLANILYGEDARPLSWEERLDIALDISHGVEYLHEGAVPPVIHRDLKSANILLDQSMRAKVADFGLSKEEKFDGRNSGLKGTFGYIDPVYIATNKFTMKSDVYSFGIIIFELITAIHPHQNLLEYINLAMMSSDGVDEILDKKLVGECNPEEVRKLAKIANKCLNKNPRRRPTMSEALQDILRIKQKRLIRDDTMSFAGQDFSQVVSRIEKQQVELSSLTSAREKVIE